MRSAAYQDCLAAHMLKFFKDSNTVESDIWGLGRWVSISDVDNDGKRPKEHLSLLELAKNSRTNQKLKLDDFFDKIPRMRRDGHDEAVFADHVKSFGENTNPYSCPCAARRMQGEADNIPTDENFDLSVSKALKVDDGIQGKSTITSEEKKIRHFIGKQIFENHYKFHKTFGNSKSRNSILKAADDEKFIGVDLAKVAGDIDILNSKGNGNTLLLTFSTAAKPQIPELAAARGYYWGEPANGFKCWKREHEISDLEECAIGLRHVLTEEMKIRKLLKSEIEQTPEAIATKIMSREDLQYLYIGEENLDTKKDEDAVEDYLWEMWEYFQDKSRHTSGNCEDNRRNRWLCLDNSPPPASECATKKTRTSCLEMNSPNNFCFWGTMDPEHLTDNLETEGRCRARYWPPNYASALIDRDNYNDEDEDKISNWQRKPHEREYVHSALSTPVGYYPENSMKNSTQAYLDNLKFLERYTTDVYDPRVLSVIAWISERKDEIKLFPIRSEDDPMIESFRQGWSCDLAERFKHRSSWVDMFGNAEWAQSPNG